MQERLKHDQRQTLLLFPHRAGCGSPLRSGDRGSLPCETALELHGQRVWTLRISMQPHYFFLIKRNTAGCASCTVILSRVDVSEWLTPGQYRAKATGCSSSRSMLLYVHRDHKDYWGRGAQDDHLDFHTAPEL